jgi:hypothetical protein
MRSAIPRILCHVIRPDGIVNSFVLSGSLQRGPISCSPLSRPHRTPSTRPASKWDDCATGNRKIGFVLPGHNADS